MNLLGAGGVHSILIIRGWYNRQTVADVPSGLSLTPPRETKKKTKLLRTFVNVETVTVDVDIDVSW
jgi:hypothetical protein